MLLVQNGLVELAARYRGQEVCPRLWRNTKRWSAAVFRVADLYYPISESRFQACPVR